MAASLTTLEDLREAGLIDADRTEALRAVAGRYAIAVTPAVAALIDSADPADPIARQYVPTADELSRLPEERDDPIGDGPHSPVPGIVHRYPDRVLLKAVHVCPVYCRFCFRREMVGPSGDGTMGPAALVFWTDTGLEIHAAGMLRGLRNEARIRLHQTSGKPVTRPRPNTASSC